MITCDYTKSELKSIQCGLYELKAGDIPMRESGICANLEEVVNLEEEVELYVKYFLQPCFMTWEHFSGNYAYPVPDPYSSDKHAAAGAYGTARVDDMWNPEHPYGSLRLDLLEHLIRECEDAIDNGGYNDE